MPVQVLLIEVRQVELVIGLEDRFRDFLLVVEIEGQSPDRTCCLFALARPLEIL